MHANNTGMSELMLQKCPFKNKTGLGTIAHRSMVRDFSGACQLQILSGLDGAGDRPQAVWDPLHQVHHGGRGRVWSCHLNPQPAAASAAGAQPWSWPAETRQKTRVISWKEEVKKQPRSEWFVVLTCTCWGSACCRTFGVNFLWFCSSCCCCCCGCCCCCCWRRSWQAWTKTDRKTKEEWDSDIEKKRKLCTMIFYFILTNQCHFNWTLCTTRIPKKWGRCENVNKNRMQTFANKQCSLITVLQSIP